MEKTVMSWSRRFDEGQLLKTILWVFSSDVPFSFQSTWNLCNSRFLVSLTNTLCQRKHAADSQPFCTALVAERSMTWLEGTWRDTVDLRVGKKIIGCDFVQRSEYEARAARDRNAAPYVSLNIWWPLLRQNIETAVDGIPCEQHHCFLSSRLLHTRVRQESYLRGANLLVY